MLFLLGVDMITFLYFCCSMLFFIAACFVGRKLSGAYYSEIKAMVFLFPNGFFLMYHWRLFMEGCVTEELCFPNLSSDYPVLTWLAFGFGLAHVFAFPVPWERRRFFRRKNKLPMKL